MKKICGFTPLFLLTKRCFNKGRAGFTLLELLIAMGLLGLIAATAVAIQISGNWFFNLTSGQRSVQSEAAYLMEHMVRHIENGPQDSERRANQGDGAYKLETGTDGSNSFIRIWTQSGDASNGYYIKYYWDRDTNPQNLRYYGDSTQQTGWGNQNSYTVLNSLRVANLTWYPQPSSTSILSVIIDLNVIDTNSGKSIAMQSTANLKQRPAKYPGEP